MKFKVSVPATSANIGPGYDIWGLALNLRNEFIVQPITNGKQHFIQINPGSVVLKTSVGNTGLELKNPSENLFIRCYEKLFEVAVMDIIYISVEVNLEIPLSRGLGSSSTAIAGGLLAANEVIRKTRGKAFSIREIYDMATQIEGHPDNVGPAIFGGLILNIKNEKQKKYVPVNLPFNAPVKFAGVIPHITLSTEDARKVVPQTNALDITIFQGTRTALLTHLFSKSEWDEDDGMLLGLAIEDRVHQPMRAALIPGMNQSFVLWNQQGAYGSYLSGAGSTLLSLWNKNADLGKVELRSALLNHGIESTVFYPEFDNLGATIEHLS